MSLGFKDKNGKPIEVGVIVKDDQGEYIVELGNFENNDGDEPIARGIGNGINKLLWLERALQFEVIEEG